MRVLFVCPDMRTGGAERHWATLAGMLRERGVEAGVLCLAEEGALFSDLVRAGVPAAVCTCGAAATWRGCARRWPARGRDPMSWSRAG